jgi:DNA helicase-2/ATP-dependent DNA helicase PcrA
MVDAIVREEQALLERVREGLADPAPAGDAGEASLVRELTRLREILVEGSESKDAGAIHQQYEQGTALLRQLREGRSAPSVERDSPYFAHLRLREDGTERDLCLGRATFLERGVRIVDWRNAPISKLYYRYAQGDDYEEEVAGRLRVGQVVARRAVTIRHGRLERVEAPEGTYVASASTEGGFTRLSRESTRLGGGEGTAIRAFASGEASGRRLGTDLAGSRRRADKRLPELAGLLDPTQFGLITKPSSGFLVLRGVAGSGKTTVALHRIAYLAFDDPAVDSDRTLVVMLSPALRSYVAHVLPSLGVTRVHARTFQDWALDCLARPATTRRAWYRGSSCIRCC